MAQSKFAKRANRANPKEERNSSNYQKSRRGGKEQQSNVVEFEDIKFRKKRVDLVPRNIVQEKMIDALMDDSKHIVFAIGSAGCGKTYLATQFAIKALQDEMVDKIIITRPNVAAGEDIGYLPGDLNEKMMPWMMPILDVFKEHYSPIQIRKMIESGVLEISPLAFMRGRTFKNAVVLFDEAQNATESQMKMVLTRIGEGSKMIITGDLEQHDRQFSKDNGLKDFTDRLATRNTGRFEVVRFTSKHVERHEVIEDILNIYKD